MTCEKPGCNSNCHLACLMPLCEKKSDHRKCEVFSQRRARKVRWSVGDAQRFLDKLEDYEFNLTSASVEGEGETTGTKRNLRVKRDEIIKLESGATLYGKSENEVSKGEPWVWSKNYYTHTIIEDPPSLKDLKDKSNATMVSQIVGTQLKHFTPFDLSVRDSAHMEAGFKMTCGVCGCSMDFHCYNTYKNVKEWVFNLSDSERKTKQMELQKLKAGEADLTSASKDQESLKRAADLEKEKALNEMEKKLQAFNQLATTQSYEAFLAKQIETLEMQLESLVEDTEMPEEFKELQKNNIKEYMSVFIKTREAMEQLKDRNTAGHTAGPSAALDEASMQATMDAQMPASDDVEVIEVAGS